MLVSMAMRLLPRLKELEAPAWSASRADKPGKPSCEKLASMSPSLAHTWNDIERTVDLARAAIALA